MRTTPALVLACVLCVVAVGCEDPSEAVPAAAVSTPVANTAPDPGGDIEGTVIAFSHEHGTIGFTGSKVTGSHDGGFKSFTGTLHLVDDDPERSRFDVTIDAGSMFTDSDKLTTHLKSADFFDAAKYPKSTFRSSAIVKSDAPGSTHRITGDLTLHGVTRTIAFPATIALDAERLRLQAEFSINRRDFGIDYDGKADNLIRDGVVLRLDFGIDR